MPAGALRLTKLAINRTYEIQGFRQTIAMGEELSVANNLDPDPETRQFRRIAGQHGMRVALGWLQAGRPDVNEWLSESLPREE